ncbi:MAG: TRAP transporter substrate-binding protein DctP [Anaerobutyricum sp.]
MVTENSWRAVKTGDIPFVVQSPAPQVSFIATALGVFDTPCLFENIDDARKAIDNPDFQKEIQKIYKGAGYDLLGIADQCFRVMTSAKPFTGIESFKGQKIRTMENAYHLQFWKQMGANPTPMSFSEVCYPDSSRETIDALRKMLTKLS